METLKFEIELFSDFWDKPPHIEIYVNDTKHFDNVLSKGINEITFTHECKYNREHRLTIVRKGNDNSQNKIDENGIMLEQYVELERLVINGINLRRYDLDLVGSKSVNIAEYPEPWATQQREAGYILDEKAIGVTRFSHNGVWYLDFSCPFTEFISDWMTH